MAKRKPTLTGTNLEIASLTDLQQEAQRLGISLRTRDGFQKARSTLIRDIQGRARTVAQTASRAATTRARKAAELGTARAAMGERLAGTREVFEQAGVKAGSRTPGAQMTFTDYIQGQQAKVMKGSAATLTRVSAELGPLPPDAQARRRQLLEASRSMRTPPAAQAAPAAAAERVAQSGAAVQGELRSEYVRARIQRRDEARYQRTLQAQAEERIQARREATQARRAEYQARTQAQAVDEARYQRTLQSQAEERMQAQEGRIQARREATQARRAQLEAEAQRETARRTAARTEIAASRPERLATAERLRAGARRSRMLPKSRLGAILGLSAAAVGGGMLTSRLVGGKPNRADIVGLAEARGAFQGGEAQLDQMEQQMALMQAAAYGGEARASLQSLVAGHERKLAQIQQGAQSSVVAQMAALGII